MAQLLGENWEVKQMRSLNVMDEIAITLVFPRQLYIPIINPKIISFLPLSKLPNLENQQGQITGKEFVTVTLQSHNERWLSDHNRD